MREVSDEIYEVSDLRIDALSHKRLWLFDLEATGLDTTRERVTQIAGLAFADGRIVEEQSFCTYVDPGPDVEISAEVRDLTGIEPAMLVGQPRFPEAWRACVEAAAGCDYWVGQSVFEFDVPLLEAEMRRHGMAPALPPIVDSVVLATALLGPPEGRWSTSALIARFGVSVEGLRRHNALDDVRILGRIVAPLVELVQREHWDRIDIPPEAKVAIKRHPPIRS
jgi:DNA polymerase III epsilon subunit-like protein